MADKMWEAWSNEATRKRLRERGLRRIADFSWRKMSEATYEIYREVLGI
jgi:glycosyltransferase involved in cell wall biosynthesis